ncbi:SET domain-containing protein [Dendrothele bispora CBS 962.96]|uniref:SET domain-containing protein n=1 Tax=Dendrothele bispora (strain CBS 962.96) TaxID=1314807 RepID=A0A4S8MX12_DENBC|nr:SET domain-containing protein [Dendrothele bispora CBS 962.96]
MKRGFLNTSKGRASMSAPTTSSSTAKPPTPFIDLSSESQKAGGLKRETVNIDGYEPEFGFKELDGTRTDHDDLEWIISRQPSTEPDATVSQYPDGWAECLITGRAKRAIVSFPGFPEALPHSDPTRPKPYELRESPGKGMGMFATRDIEYGELILAERPLLVVPAAFTMITVPLHFTEAQRHQAVLNQTEQMLEKIVDRMPEETKQAYQQLYNCHKEDGSGPLFGIVRTNGLALSDYYEPSSPGLPENARYYTGVCNTLSRINHSCCPNSNRDWDSPTFSFFLRSARSIKKDEEITICYNGDILDPTASRQRQLASYGFRCSCQRCLNSTVSDKRAKKIKEYTRPQLPTAHSMMLIPGVMPTMPTALGDVKGEKIDPALKGLELIEAEGLQSTWRYGELLKRLAEEYGNMGPGYEDEVKKYKDLHRTYQLVNMGARNADTKKQKEDEAKIPPNAIDVIKQMMAGMNMAS